MKGQYTDKEIKNMPGIISSVYQLNKGRIVRKAGKTINYYMQHSDTSWTNYKCRTLNPDPKPGP